MLKKRPYLLLLLGAVLFLMVGFLVSGEDVMDWNAHDTYYVISHRDLCWMIAETLGVLTLVYFVLGMAKVKLQRVLSSIHIYGTLLCVMAWVFPYSHVFKREKFPLFDDLQNVNLCLSISGLLFLLLQLLFIINIFVSITKKISNSAA